MIFIPGETPSGSGPAIGELFERQVRLHPDRIAYRSGSESFSYDALNRRSNRVAHAILARTPPGEQRVGIRMRQGGPQVAALMGTLKAGKTAVLLDAEGPEEGALSILADAAVELLITDRAGAVNPTATVPGGGVLLETEDPGKTWPEGNPGFVVRADAVALLVYTSGSTGQPKGVIRRHQNMVWNARFIADAHALEARDRFCFLASPATGNGIANLFRALLNGATILAFNLRERGIESLAGWLLEQQATVLSSPSSVFRHFAQTLDRAPLEIVGRRVGKPALPELSRPPWEGGFSYPPRFSHGPPSHDAQRRPLDPAQMFPDVRLVCLTSEPVLRRDVEAYRRHFIPDCRLANVISCTESGMMASQLFDHDTVLESESAPVGRPLPGVELRLIDATGGEVGIDQVGEITVRSPGVATGYWNRPELSALRFGPAGWDGGDRVFHTGDLGIRRADGGLEHVGRRDLRVKIRGVGVEIEGVEAVLGEHPGLLHAAVSVRTDERGEPRLIAFIVPAGNEVPTAAELRHHLQRRFPEPMLPSAFIPLVSLPRTLNGKLDRQALSLIPWNLPVAPSGESALQTPLEIAIEAIWKEVLGVGVIGGQDNFYDLGGHSLSATRVLSRLRGTFAVEVLIGQFLQNPTIAWLAAQVVSGGSRKEGSIGPVGATLESGARRDGLPLSFAQQRLWFLEQLTPGSAVQNLPWALRLRGVLDRTVLSQSLTEIVRRHESVRTVFRATQGTPRQVILAPVTMSPSWVDLEGVGEADREVELQRRLRQEARRPFDLEEGPLLRALLIRLDPRQHVLLLTMHHLVSDRWSRWVLTRELTTLYAALVQGLKSPLPELALQYSDVTLWQLEHFGGDRLKTQVAYWKNRLAGLESFQLPTDRPRAAVVTSSGAMWVSRLPAPLVAGLNEFSRRQNVSLYATLLATFQVLLHRLAGPTDIAVGTAVANRNHLDLEGLIGFFVNTLVIRGDLSGNPPFHRFLQGLWRVILEAYDHQDLPFERFVDELRPRRDPGRHPLFQVFFLLQNVPDEALALPGIGIETIELESETAKFDLSVILIEEGGVLKARWEYDPDLFDATTIGRMAGHYETLLGAILENPERTLSDLPLLSAAERNQALAGGLGAGMNPDQRDFARRGRIHEWFVEQAANTPDAVAAVFAEGSLSYRELDARSNQLAHHLRALGVGPDRLVGICVERSLDLPVAVLGILKAGGACVPLDPAYPMARLEWMLDDAQLEWVVVQRGLAGRLPSRGFATVCVDDAGIRSRPVEGPAPVNSPADLAYVLFTSGSTGRPKGVQVPHRTLENLVAWQLGESGCGAGDRTLQFASLSFDVSFQELFATWAGGGILVLVSEATRRDLEILAGVIREQNIARVFLPFVVLDALAGEWVDSRRPPLMLREVITAGEQLRITPTLCALFGQLEDAVLVNQYGPTETHVATALTLSGPPASWPTLPAIGRPIAHTTAHILDAQLRPVPIGVAGELHLGGAGVARGYLNRPELTAEKFITDPFDPREGARLYRTGDRCRCQPNGDLEFLGRWDDQVKIRGYRIEPGEVESVLQRAPGVRECVVAARGTGAGEKQLVAYMVAADPATAPDPAVLSGFLGQRLPEHLVPTAFVWLARLPLTPNGKIDRPALAAQAPLRRPVDAAEASPCTPAEALLLEVWEEVLQVRGAGVHENFFALGGHSLLATRVMARIRSQLGVEMPLRTIFEFPTVAGLAGQLSRFPSGHRAGMLPLGPVTREGPLPLSFAQQRLWFLEKLEGKGTGYHLSEALRLSGEFHHDALERAVNRIVARHESLRTGFVQEGAGAVQVIASECRVEVPLVDLGGWAEGAREEALAAALRAERGRPYELDRGPLLRVAVFRLAPRTHLLLIHCHHIVFDGWSGSVFHRELSALYQAYSLGLDDPLPPLPLQYPDYAVWQRRWLQDAELERQWDYWREQLTDSPTLELPTDRSRPLHPSHRGARQTWVIPASVGIRLREFNERENVTPFMSLLAVFQILLARLGGQEDIVVGTPIANRGRVELENLIGFFVNTLVLRTDLSGQPDFREVVARVRQTALDAYHHQDLPFEILVERLNPERDLARQPLFQAMFAVQNAPAHPAALAGLEVTPWPLPTQSTQFDLGLYLTLDGETWTGSVHYATDLFDAATIARLGGHFLMLLDTLLGQPELPVFQAPILSESERHQLLVEWNDTTVGYPSGQSLPALFEAQVRRNPDATALVEAGRALSYQTLNTQANRLAHHLVAVGVKQGDFVGLHLDRSVAFVVSVLAVLKAGAAYVPLPPDHPAARLQFMRSDTRASFVITGSPLPAELAGDGVRIIALDRLESTLAGYAPTRPATRADSGDAAYVLYTSGSTGQPKGVIVPHRAVVRLVQGTGFLPWGPDLRFLLLAPVAFDASTLELWGPLLHGAVCVIFPGIRPDLHELEQVIRDERISCLWLTAGLFNRIVDDRPSLLRPVTHLLTGGEALSPAHVRRALELLPETRLTNGYGPTESTTFACTQALPRWNEAWGRGSIPIGRPIANTRCRVLDGHRQLVPIGVAGELYIGGDGLALGYLGDPGLTADRFIPDPFGSGPADRLYKTGDRCRWLSDGTLEFLGRLDGQLKVRGFRVEPGEIEVALARHPAVQAAAVIPFKGVPGDLRLAAYVVARAGQRADPETMRGHLRGLLPEPMIPAVFVEMERLPLTPNGKVDRKALPAPDQAEAGGPADPVRPATLMEEQVARIWGEVLGRERIGADDNFFQLGGHSLLAIQVLARLDRVLGWNVPLRMLFEQPTVAGLAGRLEALQWAGGVPGPAGAVGGGELVSGEL